MNTLCGLLTYHPHSQLTGCPKDRSTSKITGVLPDRHKGACFAKDENFVYRTGGCMKGATYSCLGTYMHIRALETIYTEVLAAIHQLPKSENADTSH